ncbi:unnamed protein product [Chrysoparadoxa australica]
MLAKMPKENNSSPHRTSNLPAPVAAIGLGFDGVDAPCCRPADDISIPTAEGIKRMLIEEVREVPSVSQRSLDHETLVKQYRKSQMAEETKALWQASTKYEFLSVEKNRKIRRRVRTGAEHLKFAITAVNTQKPKEKRATRRSRLRPGTAPPGGSAAASPQRGSLLSKVQRLSVPESAACASVTPQNRGSAPLMTGSTTSLMEGLAAKSPSQRASFIPDILTAGAVEGKPLLGCSTSPSGLMRESLAPPMDIKVHRSPSSPGILDEEGIVGRTRRWSTAQLNRQFTKDLTAEVDAGKRERMIVSHERAIKIDGIISEVEGLSQRKEWDEEVQQGGPTNPEHIEELLSKFNTAVAGDPNWSSASSWKIRVDRIRAAKAQRAAIAAEMKRKNDKYLRSRGLSLTAMDATLQREGEANVGLDGAIGGRFGPYSLEEVLEICDLFMHFDPEFTGSVRVSQIMACDAVEGNSYLKALFEGLIQYKVLDRDGNMKMEELMETLFHFSKAEERKRMMAAVSLYQLFLRLHADPHSELRRGPLGIGHAHAHPRKSQRASLAGKNAGTRCSLLDNAKARPAVLLESTIHEIEGVFRGIAKAGASSACTRDMFGILQHAGISKDLGLEGWPHFSRIASGCGITQQHEIEAADMIDILEAVLVGRSNDQ